MKSLELTLAPKVQTDNLEKTWEKIPVRGVDGERHHALPVRNDEERAAFNRELKSKIEAFTTSEKRDNHSEKKNVTSSKKNEKNCDAPAVERVKKEEVSSEEFSEESVEAAAAAVIEGDAVATPEESIEATKEVAETTDPVNGLINDKIEKIKELCAKLGIEVNTDNLTNEEFIAKAIKILEHLLNPIHEDSLITVRVSVEDAVAQMQQNPAVKEPVTADEIMPAMEALLYELVALQTLLKSSVASIDKDALMSEIAELTGETEVAADADMMIESVKPESETPKEIKIANVELIEDSVAPVVSDKIVVTSEAVPAVKPEEIAVVTTPVTASVVAEKKAIEIPEDVKSTENEIKGEKNDSLELVDAVLKTDDKEETLTGEQFTSQDNRETPKEDSAPVEEIPVAATTEDKIETIVNPIIKAIGELKEAVSNMGADSSANVKAIKAETVQVQRAETAHGFARPTSDKAVMQQITTKFQLIQAQHGSEIRMQLKPEHLGSVKISLEIQQDTVVARLQVDSDRVKHIVETNLQQLRDTLAEQGLKMEKCEVSVNNGSNDFFKRELSENGRRIRGKIRQEIGGGEGSEAGEGKGKVDSGRGLGYSTVAFVG